MYAVFHNAVSTARLLLLLVVVVVIVVVVVVELVVVELIVVVVNLTTHLLEQRLRFGGKINLFPMRFRDIN
jgi:hypothetical protein